MKTKEMIEVLMKRLGYELDNDGQIVIYTGRFIERENND